MAGQAVASCLDPPAARGKFVFSIATTADEPEIRRLLRETPTGGPFVITLEREPNAFAGAGGIALSQGFIIARDAETGAPVGICERTVRDCFVDGVEARLPYLGALRVVPSSRGQVSILRGGFDALKYFAHEPGELPFALTAIATGNETAKRILTAGIRGIPHYVAVEEVSTFALRPRFVTASLPVRPARPDDLPAIAAFLSTSNRGLQFAEVWTEMKLRNLAQFGLAAEHFLIFEQNGRIRGTIAVWDQRKFRQTVVHRYPFWLGRLRAAFNLVAPLTRMPECPPTGVPVNQAMLSHFAIDGDDTKVFCALVDAALNAAARRGFRAALLGMATARELSRVVRKFWRFIEYKTTIYLVCWPNSLGHTEQQVRSGTHVEIAMM